MVMIFLTQANRSLTLSFFHKNVIYCSRLYGINYFWVTKEPNSGDKAKNSRYTWGEFSLSSTKSLVLRIENMLESFHGVTTWRPSHGVSIHKPVWPDISGIVKASCNSKIM